MEIRYSLDEIDNVAKQIIEATEYKTLLFYGEMGAGKTTLIKEICKQLGVRESISSPTFSLVNEYETAETVIFHFDFYRIENPVEALDMGIEEYFAKNVWNFIEWPQKIEDFLPKNAHKIEILLISNNVRMLKFC